MTAYRSSQPNRQACRRRQYGNSHPVAPEHLRNRVQQNIDALSRLQAPDEQHFATNHARLAGGLAWIGHSQGVHENPVVFDLNR